MAMIIINQKKYISLILGKKTIKTNYTQLTYKITKLGYAI